MHEKLTRCINARIQLPTINLLLISLLLSIKVRHNHNFDPALRTQPSLSSAYFQFCVLVVKETFFLHAFVFDQLLLKKALKEESIL